MRNVRGVLFLDYVRMLKAHKGVEWDAILAPEDAPYLKQQIDTTAWYPMEPPPPVRLTGTTGWGRCFDMRSARSCPRPAW